MPDCFIPDSIPVYPGTLQTYVPCASIVFTLTEYDPDRPWIVRVTGRHVIELPDDEDFAVWAADRWPDQRFRVELDPKLEPMELLTGRGAGIVVGDRHGNADLLDLLLDVAPLASREHGILDVEP
jgi:hypothetical protein